MIAVAENDPKMVTLLLDYYGENGPDINRQDKQKITILHIACCTPLIHTDILEVLLKFQYIDVTVKNSDENTPLHYFCEKTQSYDCEKIGDMLIKLGADVNAENILGETPLHKAIFNRSVKVLLVDMLVRHKTKVNCKTIEKYDTPLHYATRLARPDLAERLIQAGGDISIKNKDELDVLQLAKQLLDEEKNPLEKKS